MRIGIYPPFVDTAGKMLSVEELATRARQIEAAGLDGIWLGDHLPIPGSTGLGRPDALMWLVPMAGATTAVEIGTNIFGVPLRSPLDVAQRLYTLETFAPGRVTFGVGTSSQSRDYDLAGLDWADRFRRLRDHMATVKSLFEVAPGTPDEDLTWAQTVGAPRFVLGAWHSELQLRRAANDYDGWMTSGMLGLEEGWKKVFSEAITRFRDLGGRRAMVSTVSIDLHSERVALEDSGTFTLVCSATEASDRLHEIAELGYDDVILNYTNRGGAPRRGAHMSDYSAELLEEFRSLLPKDPQSYRET